MNHTTNHWSIEIVWPLHIVTTLWGTKFVLVPLLVWPTLYLNVGVILWCRIWWSVECYISWFQPPHIHEICKFLVVKYKLMCWITYHQVPCHSIQHYCKVFRIYDNSTEYISPFAVEFLSHYGGHKLWQGGAQWELALLLGWLRNH